MQRSGCIVFCYTKWPFMIIVAMCPWGSQPWSGYYATGMTSLQYINTFQMSNTSRTTRPHVEYPFCCIFCGGRDNMLKHLLPAKLTSDITQPLRRQPRILLHLNEKMLIAIIHNMEVITRVSAFPLMLSDLFISRFSFKISLSCSRPQTNRNTPIQASIIYPYHYTCIHLHPFQHLLIPYTHTHIFLWYPIHVHRPIISLYIYP